MKQETKNTPHLVLTRLILQEKEISQRGGDGHVGGEGSVTMDIEKLTEEHVLEG